MASQCSFNLYFHNCKLKNFALRVIFIFSNFISFTSFSYQNWIVFVYFLSSIFNIVHFIYNICWNMFCQIVTCLLTLFMVFVDTQIFIFLLWNLSIFFYNLWILNYSYKIFPYTQEFIHFSPPTWLVLFFMFKICVCLEFILVCCVKEWPNFIYSKVVNSYLSTLYQKVHISLGNLRWHLYHMLNFFVYLSLLLNF